MHFTADAEAAVTRLIRNVAQKLNQTVYIIVFHAVHFVFNKANTGLAALEETPGRLLRITTDTGDKHFSQAAAALDPVGTAGHLVSMVVADGIDNAPTALLANHMQTSLAAAVAKEGKDVY